MKCLISIPLQARYHYYPFLQTEVLRGCLLTHPSSHSQGALAFSENPRFCGLSEAASKQAPQLTSRSRSARPPRTGRGCAWRPRSGSTPLRRWFWPRPVGTGPQGTLTRSSSLCLVSWSSDCPFYLEGKSPSSCQHLLRNRWKLAPLAQPSLSSHPLRSRFILPSPLQTGVVRPSSAALLFRHRVTEPSRLAPLPIPVWECRQCQLPGGQQPPERGRHQPQHKAAWPSGRHR